MAQTVEERAQMIASLELVKDKMSPYMLKQLEMLKEQQKVDLRVAPGQSVVKKGVVMAALYLLGGSYGQIATLFGVQKATVAQAVKNQLGRVIMRDRPHHSNKSAISWEQVTAYFHAAQQLAIPTPGMLAKHLSELAKADEEDSDEDVFDLRNEAGAQATRIGQGSE